MDCGHWIVQDKPKQFQDGMLEMIAALFWKNFSYANCFIRGGEILAEALREISPGFSMNLT
jgi:hypothetical protein